MLFNQFHDLAAGSGIGVIYKDAQKDYDVVRWSTNEISTGAADTLVAKINTSTASKGGGAASLVVFNPLGWTRSGTVIAHIPGYPSGFTLDDPSAGLHAISFRLLEVGAKGSDNYAVPVVNIPAVGYKTLRITSGCNEAGCHELNDRMIMNADDMKPINHSLWLDNNMLHVKVDEASGCITSIVNKKSGAESIAPGGCGNQLQFFKDTPKDYDAWNIDPGTLDHQLDEPAKADSVESIGGDSPAIRVTRTWQSSKFVQTMSLSGDQIDIDNDIDWHETPRAAEGCVSAGGFGAICHLRDTLRNHRPTHNAQQQLGAGAV